MSQNGREPGKLERSWNNNYYGLDLFGAADPDPEVLSTKENTSL